MSSHSYHHESGPMRTLRKYAVSTFVALSFGAYVFHERMVPPGQLANAAVPPGNPTTTQWEPTPRALAALPRSAERDRTSDGLSSPSNSGSSPAPNAAPIDGPAGPDGPAVPDGPSPVPKQAASPVPTTVPSPIPTPETPQGQYRDGDYPGQLVDAYYGLLQVQASIQQGRLADVQILAYPNDRRTSIRINRIAIPYLNQEAVQAQSAKVHIISGATLTSEAFIASLRSALAAAQA